MLKAIATSPAKKLHVPEGWKALKSKRGLGVAVILAILFVRFFRTIVLGKSISKLFLLAHWDPCFSALQAGENFGIDGTLLLVMIPYKFFVAQCWRHSIPLWNALSGFGVPLAADPQSQVFSPLMIPFFLFPTMYMWNQTLIIQLVIASIATYLLCLEFEFGSIAALVAAILFTFCPWVQWQLEIIGNGVCMTPFVFLFFVKAAKTNAIKPAIIAGIVTAICILAGHPEMSFITVTFATVIMYMTAYAQNPANFSFWQISKRVLLIGLIALGLTAIMLFPFKEYIANGYTYKLTTSAPANITWQALLANYFYPLHSVGSVFWGPVSWLGFAGLATMFSRRSRHTSGIAICLILSFLFIPKLFPLSMLFAIFPFSSLESIYCLPEYILFISIISGLGINILLKSAKDISWKTFFVVSALAIAPIAVSALLSFCHLQDSYMRTDQASQFASFSWKLWRINSLCIVGLLVCCALLRNRSRVINTLAFTALAALSLSNLLFISHSSLPIRPDFNYPQNLPDLLGAKSDERFITVGSSIFRHNTNLVYGLRNVQSYNPLLPKYFVEFMEACGAQTNDRFSQIFSPMISPNIDLTGAKRIISAQPLLDEYAVNKDVSRGNALYTNGLKLSEIKLLKADGAIFCSLIADPNFSTTQNCSLYLEVKEANGEHYALGDPQSIASWRLKQSLVFSGKAPENQEDWLLLAKLISDKDQKLISPAKTTLGHIETDGSWTIATNKSKPFTKVESDRFKAKSSFHDIVTYENLTALKQYFFVNKIIWVKDKQESLELLNHSGKFLRDSAVMEESQRKEFENLRIKLASSNIFDTSGTVEKVDASDQINHFSASSALSLSTETQNPSLLIISDLFYPGWKSFIDGKECPTFCAHCLFRAVLIPAGKHQVLFEYQPLSFTIGAALFIVTIISLVLMWIKSNWR